MDNTPLSSCNETNSVVLCKIVSTPFFVAFSHCIHGIILLIMVMISINASITNSVAMTVSCRNIFFKYILYINLNYNEHTENTRIVVLGLN